MLFTIRNFLALPDRFYALCEEAIGLLRRLVKVVAQQKPQIHGAHIMFVVKNNQPDVPYTIAPGQVTDAEGELIDDAKLSYEVSSTDDAVVSITPGADSLSGTVHFGKSGVASVNVTAKSGADLLASFGAQFTVTKGDPAAITAGTISFGGLTEAEEPPVDQPTDAPTA